MSQIEITDANGLVRLQGSNLSGGGSQPLVVRFPFTYQTAGILTGVTVYDPAPGDIIVPMQSSMSITTAFNGTTPHLSVISQGSVPSDGQVIADFNATTVNPVLDNGAPDTHIHKVLNLAAGDTTDNYLSDGTPIQIFLGDNNGGNPGASQGVGELILVILKAS